MHLHFIVLCIDRQAQMRDIESNKIINATYVYYFKNEIDNK